MARIAAVLALVLAPCPVLRTPPMSAPVAAVMTRETPDSVVSSKTRPVRAKTLVVVRRGQPRQNRGDGVGLVRAPLVTRRLGRPATTSAVVRRSQQAAKARTRAARVETAGDFPHTRQGLLAFAASLPYPWGPIIRCESAGDGSWRVTSSSRARGILQFLPSTWRSLGLTGDPASYSWRYQYAAALKLRARDGISAWECARILHVGGA